jgi:glutathione peroxidase
MMRDLSRRLMLGGALALAGATTAKAAGRLAWEFRFPSIEEDVLDFASFRGRVLLVANTASFCGYTYQYEALESLHASLEPRGLTVIGIPSQDFYQESGSNAAVKAFCEATFGVRFPMTGITRVRGAAADPFYLWVKQETNGWQPSWNFNKVLIGRDGRIAGTFRSGDEPNGPRLTQAIEAALRQAPSGV